MSSSLTWSIIIFNLICHGEKNVPPRPGIEPGPSTWQAEILTTRLSRIVLGWVQILFEHVFDRLAVHVASWENVHYKVRTHHPIGNMKIEKNIPILRAGFEPATYGYLMWTTTVHRSTNWAIEGGEDRFVLLNAKFSLVSNYLLLLFPCSLVCWLACLTSGGDVAQMVERSLSMWEVGGSIPPVSKIFRFIFYVLKSKMKKCSAVGRIRTYAPRGKLISSQSP